MLSAGYDLVAVVDEALINRVLAAAYYHNFKFPVRVTRTVNPPGVPADLAGYARMRVSLRVKEPPSVDALSTDRARLVFSAEAHVRVLNSLTVEVDARAFCDGMIQVDPTTGNFRLNLEHAQVTEIQINDTYKLPGEFLANLSEAIAAIYQTVILAKLKYVQFSPLTAEVELPKLGDPDPSHVLRVPVRVGAVKILNDHCLAVAANLLASGGGGDPGALTDFLNGTEVSLAASEAGMQRFFNWWWAKNMANVKIIKAHTFHLPANATYVDELVQTGAIVLSSLLTGGLFTQSIEVKSMTAVLRLEVGFPRPSFHFEAGEIHLADVMVQVDLHVKITIDYDTIEYVVGIEVARQHHVETVLDENFIANGGLSHAAVHVTRADSGELTVDLEQLHLSANLPFALPDILLDWVLDWIDRLVNDHFPRLTFMPPVISKQIPGTPFTVAARLGQFRIDPDEMVLGGQIAVADMPRTICPVPLFVANNNPFQREVHRLGCPNIEKMNEEHKVGYFILIDALRDGYDGCKDCIPEYHRR